MPNYLAPMKTRFDKARKELEQALKILQDDLTNPSNFVQSLKVDGPEMAEVFKEKPVILIQSMNIKIVQINNNIQNALRYMEQIDTKLYRELFLRDHDVKRSRWD